MFECMKELKWLEHHNNIRLKELLQWSVKKAFQAFLYVCTKPIPVSKNDFFKKLFEQ